MRPVLNLNRLSWRGGTPGGQLIVSHEIHNYPGEVQHLACDGVFVAIGHDPETELFRDLVDWDEQGFIKVEANTTHTSAPGIFACGDVCDPVYKQAVVAAGRGCMAALDAQKYLESVAG
ncbi:MAG: FAD-dependent oxidoreductase [Pirellulaceae bacterium]